MTQTYLQNSVFWSLKFENLCNNFWPSKYPISISTLADILFPTILAYMFIFPEIELDICHINFVQKRDHDLTQVSN